MTPDTQAKLLRIAAVLRRKTAVSNLLREIGDVLLSAVPADYLRLDLGDDQGKLWSRVCRYGQDPERPGLGAVNGIRSTEALARSEEEGVHGISIPLGLGDVPTGRLVLKRRSGAFTKDDEEALVTASHLFSIGLRSRPFEPPPKPRNPFEDGAGPLV